jgi:hypothetical protein
MRYVKFRPSSLPFTFGWTTGVLVSIVGKTYEAQFAHLRNLKHKEGER